VPRLAIAVAILAAACTRGTTTARPTPPPAPPTSSTAPPAPDVDGDGRPDPVAIAAAAGRWGVVAHLSRTGDRYAWQPGGATGRAVAGVVDVNGDGHPEIVVRLRSDATGQAYAVVALVRGALVWAHTEGQATPTTFRARSGVTPMGWGCGGGELYQVAMDLTEAPIRAQGTRTVYTLRDGVLADVGTWGTLWHPRREQPPPEFTAGVACGGL
jgi:hypothetical protein